MNQRDPGVAGLSLGGRRAGAGDHTPPRPLPPDPSRRHRLWWLLVAAAVPWLAAALVMALEAWR